MGLLFSWSLFLTLLLSASVADSVHGGNETDRLALLSFKAQITGDQFGTLKSWNESIHFCQWVGVTCSRHHPMRVTGLNLDHRKLMGAISLHIGNLSFLKELSLNNNSFSHEIPPQLGCLKRLQGLEMVNNSFTEYGMGNEVSTSGDVYSYGILVLEMFTAKRPTHSMFIDGMTLHNFAKTALAEQVESIADPTLLQQTEQGEVSSSMNSDRSQSSARSHKIREILISILNVGIACSEELPRDRPPMNEVLTWLHVCKKTLLRYGRCIR